MIHLRTDDNGNPMPVSYQTLRRWRDDKLLPFTRIGGRFFYVRAYVYHLFGITESHQDIITAQEIQVMKDKAKTLHDLKSKGTIDRYKRKQKAAQIARENREELEAAQAEMAARGEIG